MKYQIYITSDFWDNKNIPNTIVDFLNKNKESSDIDITTIPYTDSICYKEIHRRYHLWFTIKSNNIITLYIPKAIEDRSYKSYFNIYSRDEMVEKFKLSDREKEEVETYFYELEPKIKEKLRPDMEVFEGIRDFSDSATSFVYEMYDWTIHISGVESCYSSIFSTLQNIIIYKEKEDNKDEDNDGWKTKKVDKTDLQIIYRINYGINATYYYLYDIVDNENLDDTINKLKAWTKKNIDKLKQNESDDLSDADKELYAKYIEFDNDNLKKQTFKGYPDFVMYGKREDWEKIEKDDDANLALSEEEIAVLQTSHYPCFINGLAGSGKSTILYYLFVNAFLYQLASKKNKNMLFLSYSGKLIESAKNVATALGTTNYHWWTTDNKISEDTIKNKIEQCFKSFKSFLKENYLTDELQLDKFNDNKHIGYKFFLERFKEWPLTDHKIRPEMVWAVIRSFIKGQNYKQLYTPEKYENVISTRKIVEIEEYRKIYDIYEKYYSKLNKDGYWDDLDMVKHILTKIEHTNKYPKYDVIFCDEAQDFTPIEIELILKTSKYFDYDLSYFKTIPIAFAGDPNQTISPTGFDWSRLKDVFNLSFSEQIGGYIRLYTETLNNNYRSKSNIIRLANSVQYIRSLFTHENLQPQNEWNTSYNPVPCFVQIENKRMSVIESSMNSIECIITGDDGEEPEFDEILSKQDKSLVCTSVSSKGLEYNTVILYKFANKMPDCFMKVFENKTLKNDEIFACEYFITKLYVAITRAEELLYIFDSYGNYQRFWKHFINNSYVNRSFEQDPYADKWRTMVGGLVEPSENEFEIIDGESQLEKNIKDKSHRYVIADRIFNNAKYEDDLSLMERAKGYFSLCKGKEKERAKNRVKECDAYIARYKKEFEKSGDLFMALSNKQEEAANSYWTGKCWTKLKKHYGRYRYRLIIADYFADNDYTLRNLISAFTNNEEWIHQYSPTDDIWVFVIDQIRKDALNNYTNDIDVLHFMEKLKNECRLSYLSDTIAEMYFEQKQFEKAVENWNSIGLIEHSSYYYAQMELAKQHENHNEIITWADKLGKNEMIIKEYGTNRDIIKYELSSKSLSIIFHILLQTDYIAALDYQWNNDAKYQNLYDTDKNKFFEYWVLDNYSPDKFYIWVEDKVKDKDYDIFNNKINQDIFTKIFSIDNDWMLFLGLRDNNNNRPFFSKKYNDAIIKSLTQDILPRRNFKNIQLTLCLFDALFGEFYSPKKSDETIGYISSIVTNIQYDRSDFYNVKSDNYFNICNITNNINIIRKNVSNFINRLFLFHEEITTKPIFQKYCIFYETILNNNKEIVSFYNNLPPINSQKNEYFINLRALFFDALKSNKAEELSKFLMDKKTKTDFLSFANRDNIIDFIELIVKNYQIADAEAYTIALIIYEKEITFNKNSKISMELEKFVDRNVEKEFNKEELNEPMIKLLCYVGEIVMDAEKSANLYNKYINIKHITHELRNYLKQRALNRYANSNILKFEVKKEEYRVIDFKLEDIKKLNRSLITITNSTQKIIASSHIKNNEPQLSKEEQQILQKKDKLDIAKSLISENIDNETIIYATDFSEKLIIALKLKYQNVKISSISKATNFSEEFIKQL